MSVSYLKSATELPILPGMPEANPFPLSSTQLNNTATKIYEKKFITYRLIFKNNTHQKH